MKKLIKLVCNQQIGDVVRSTTIAKFFKEQYPEYELEISVSHPSVYDNNPNVKGLTPGVKNTSTEEEQKRLVIVAKQDDENGEIDNKYSIHKLKENNADMVMAMVGYINAKYGFDLKVTNHYADLYLTKEEKKPFKDLPKKYWLVNCGCEPGNTRKLYPYKYWQEIFKALPDEKFIQIGLSKDKHPKFKETNVINKIDAYSIRQTFSLALNSCGVIAPYTYIIHVGATFKKPVIVIGGGGEDISWENYDYPEFNLLHTIDSFDCCRGGGCWKAHCENKEQDGTSKCMGLIKPQIIIDLIKKYTEGGD